MFDWYKVGPKTSYVSGVTWNPYKWPNINGYCNWCEKTWLVIGINCTIFDPIYRDPACIYIWWFKHLLSSWMSIGMSFSSECVDRYVIVASMKA